MTSAHIEHCRQLLEQAFPQPPASLDAARRRLEQLRGTRIRVAVTDPGRLALPTGLWIELGQDADIVWADATLSEPHQLVTICHEFGHMICGHQPTAFGGGTADGLPRNSIAALAGVSGSAATAVLGRCGSQLPLGDSLGRRLEAEAETTGRLLARPFLHDHQAELAALLVGR